MAYPFVRLLLLVGFTETPHSFGDTRFWMHFRIWQTMLPLTALLRLTKLFSPSRTRAIIARVRHLLCHARLISVVILHISEACPKKRYVFLVRLIGMACLSPRLRILVEFLQEIYIIFMMVGLRPVSYTHLDVYKRQVQVFLKLLAQLDLEADVRQVLNINVPARPWEEIQGVRWAPQGDCIWLGAYEERVSPSGRRYFWSTYGGYSQTEGDDDRSLLEKGYVTLTPLTYEMTDPAGFSGKEYTL